MGGRKDDNGKLRYDLIPTGPLALLAGAYTVGAVKYSDRNWETGMAYSRYYGAAQRHLNAYWGGEDIDPDNGQHHLAAAAFCLFALMEYGKTHPELDDRPHTIRASKCSNNRGQSTKKSK